MLALKGRCIFWKISCQTLHCFNFQQKVLGYWQTAGESYADFKKAARTGEIFTQ